MARKPEKATIISQEQLSSGIFSMWIATEAAAKAGPGQFISIYTNNASKLLPRPISICDIDNSGKLRIVYRVTGEGTGTDELSKLSAGDTIRILAPLGNGNFGAMIMAQNMCGNDASSAAARFTREQLSIGENTTALLIGGGIGIPPMLGLAKRLACRKEIVAGYRNANELFLTKELEANGTLTIATDDGSFGVHGTVIDAIKEKGIKADMIFACGPKPMLRGVKALGEEWGVPTYVSMEERMACGVGACLGCVCKTTQVDGHSNVKNKRVCVDGPVFLSGEVEL